MLKKVMEILRSRLASMATEVMLLKPPPGEQAAKMIPMAWSSERLKKMHIRKAVCGKTVPAGLLVFNGGEV